MVKVDNDNTIKRVYKVFGIVCLVVSVIILLIELVLKLYTFFFLCSYLIGALISGLLFYLSDLVLKWAMYNFDSKHNVALIGFNFFKLFIYGLCLTLVFISPMEYGIFTCFIGLLSIRISILIEYSIIEKIKDKKRTIEKLNIKKEIKDKLRFNNIINTNALSELSHDDLSKFLNDDEISEVSKSLREYGLFLKGELEVIKEDEDAISK